MLSSNLINLHTTCLSLLHKQKCLTLDHLKQIHSIFITTSLSHPTFFIPKLLHFISINGYPCFDPSYIFSLLGRIPTTPNPFLLNTMIKNFSSSSISQPEISFVLFSKLRQQGVLPDPYTYSLLLKVLSRSKTENPNQIHAQSFKFGFFSDSFVQNSLLSAYANGGYLGFACQVFDEIYQRDLVSWTAMIDGYVKNNQPKKGLDCFMKMRLMNVEVDEVTIVSVLSAAGMLGSLWFGKCVHGFYIESGRVKWDVFVGAALLNMYAKCGCCDEAHKVFNEMPIRNVVSWSSLISSYLRGSRVKEALNVFQDMLIEQVKPNETTLSSVLTACAQSGALDQGRWVHT